jgi:hypothetical protein
MQLNRNKSMGKQVRTYFPTGDTGMNGGEADGGSGLTDTDGDGADLGETVDGGDVGTDGGLADAGTSDDLGIGGDLADGPGGRDL